MGLRRWLVSRSRVVAWSVVVAGRNAPWWRRAHDDGIYPFCGSGAQSGAMKLNNGYGKRGSRVKGNVKSKGKLFSPLFGCGSETQGSTVAGGG